MPRPFAFVVTLGPLLFSCGCTEQVDGLQVGMTRDQVAAVLVSRGVSTIEPRPPHPHVVVQASNIAELGLLFDAPAVVLYDNMGIAISLAIRSSGSCEVTWASPVAFARNFVSANQVFPDRASCIAFLTNKLNTVYGLRAFTNLPDAKALPVSALSNSENDNWQYMRTELVAVTLQFENDRLSKVTENTQWIDRK